jgi:hypothetical protein
MKKNLTLVFLLLALKCFGQDFFSFNNLDTIKYNYRTGGEKIDSVADYFTGTLSLNSGGYLFNPFGNFQNNYELGISSLSSPFRKIKETNFKYSSLPHLGFQYSFGSKSLQMLHAEYQQFLSKKFGINIEINRSSLGDMIRNGSYKNQDLILKSYYKGKFYKNYNEIYHSNSFFSNNGGLDTAQSVQEFPLEFLKVRKSEAETNLSYFKLSNKNHFNFLQDSLKDLGLLIHNQLEIQNRKFTESNANLSTLYSNIFIDSFFTQDQYQVSELKNAAGIYAFSKQFEAEALVNHSYWKYYNLGKDKDTNELDLLLNLRLRLKSFHVSNSFSFNFIGANQEFSNYFRLNLNSKSKLRLSYSNVLKNELPSLFQRSYFSNNNNWNLTKLENQFTLQNEILAEYRINKSLEIKGGLNHQNLKNNYYFVNDTWRNDTLNNLSLLSFNLKANVKVGDFILQPLFIINQFSKDLKFIPKFDFRTRIIFNKKLFAAKKLNFLLAADFAYLTKNNLLDYRTEIGLFTLQNQSSSISNRYKIDFTTAFQIEEFRFFLKLENINYFWTNEDMYVFESIPSTPFYIRLGLTWDFFN